MLSLKTIILKYLLVCVFLVSPCCVHRNRRPDPTVSVVPSPRFVLFVFSSVLFVPVFCPSRQASPHAASPHARRSREFMPPFAALPSRGSREFTPPFAALPSRGSRDFLPPFAAQRSRRSRELTPPFAALPSRRSREFTPPFADQPALSSLEMTPPSTANPSPPACLWLNARRPASDSMPAGLPLIPARQECRWLKLAGLPLTQARRIAADSCNWSSAGKANSPLSVSRRRPRPTCVSRASSTRGKPTRRPRFTRPAAGWGSLQPAGPCRCVVKPAGCCHYLSSQPIMVSPDGRCRIDKPAGRGRIWPDSDHGLFNCFCMVSPGGLLIPLSFPKEILGGGSRAPAEETEVGAGAAVSEAVPPWPPELPAPPWPPELPALPWPSELPAPPWPPELPAPPWPPELPAPPWPPELPAPPGPRSVCSTLEAPSCVCICVGPVGSPECPPPLPGSTVTARDVPSGRGELC